MAKKRKKPKGRNKPLPGAAPGAGRSGEPAVGEDEAEFEAAGEDEEEDGGAEDDRPAREEPAAAATAARADKPTRKVRGRGAARPRPGPVSPDHDPNLPSPDGPRVSNKGGLVFVGIVLALIGLAIAAQFAMGQ